VDDDKIKLTPTEARAGSTSGKVRLVLVVSLVLVVIAFAAVFMRYG
jgi:hypothetical protein